MKGPTGADIRGLIEADTKVLADLICDCQQSVINYIIRLTTLNGQQLCILTQLRCQEAL